MSNLLKLYTQNDCGYCVSMKRKLDSWGIEYETINISEDTKGKQFLKEQGLKTVPQLFFKDLKLNNVDTNMFDQHQLLQSLRTVWPGQDSGVEDMS
tara:strand:- start:1781 stop:2068 length:288 start_codon:yes stop_codon:yes gene_type:complete